MFENEAKEYVDIIKKEFPKQYLESEINLEDEYTTAGAKILLAGEATAPVTVKEETSITHQDFKLLMQINISMYENVNSHEFFCRAMIFYRGSEVGQSTQGIDKGDSWDEIKIDSPESLVEEINKCYKKYRETVIKNLVKKASIMKYPDLGKELEEGFPVEFKDTEKSKEEIEESSFKDDTEKEWVYDENDEYDKHFRETNKEVKDNLEAVREVMNKSPMKKVNDSEEGLTYQHPDLPVFYMIFTPEEDKIHITSEVAPQYITPVGYKSRYKIKEQIIKPEDIESLYRAIDEVSYVTKEDIKNLPTPRSNAIKEAINYFLENTWL